jgi:hypothetical protein
MLVIDLELLLLLLDMLPYMYVTGSRSPTGQDAAGPLTATCAASMEGSFLSWYWIFLFIRIFGSLTKAWISIWNIRSIWNIIRLFLSIRNIIISPSNTWLFIPISICLHRRYLCLCFSRLGSWRINRHNKQRDELLLFVLLSLLWLLWGDSNAKVLVPSALGGV